MALERCLAILFKSNYLANFMELAKRTLKYLPHLMLLPGAIVVIVVCLLVAGKANAKCQPEILTDYVRMIYAKLLPINKEQLRKFTSTPIADSNGNVEWVQNDFTYNLSCFDKLPNGITRCNKDTKKVSDLTIAELMLLYGARTTINGKERYINSLHIIWSNYLNFYITNGRLPKDMRELYGLSESWEENIKEKISANPLMVTRFYSPISYEPLDFNHAEFSPGQLYITPITDPNPSLLNIPNPENKKFVLGKNLFAIYVRVYGEDKVIYETTVVSPIGTTPPVI